MSKSILAIAMLSVLSGCVTPGGPTSQSALHSGQVKRVVQAPSKGAASRETSRSPIVIGEAY